MLRIDEGTPLSDVFADKVGHISALIIESLSDTDEIYILEIAYGAAKTNITRHRFMSGVANKLPGVMYVRIRAPQIPAGEEIYWRMAGFADDAICKIHVRYHFHE